MLGKNTVITKVVREIESGKILSRRLRWTDLPFAKLMGVRFPTVTTNTFVGPLPANATETVILTTPGISEPIDNAQVIIAWAAYISAGVGVTNHQFRLRRGTTAAGALVNVANMGFVATAGIVSGGAGVYFDSPGVVAGQQYSLTVQQGGATGAGTWSDGCLLAMVL